MRYPKGRNALACNDAAGVVAAHDNVSLNGERSGVRRKGGAHLDTMAEIMNSDKRRAPKLIPPPAVERAFAACNCVRIISATVREFGSA